MSRPSYERYIIYTTSKTSLFKRVRDILLTLLLWLAYLYFMRDFFAFLRHFIAWRLHPQTSAAPDFNVFYVLLFYMKIILAMAAVFLGWAYYNLIRFRGKNRRKSVPVTTVEAVAQTYNVTPADILLWQQQRALVMDHDTKGNLVSVSPRNTDAVIS